jgi:GNAT superfamily N-acetyltransferase
MTTPQLRDARPEDAAALAALSVEVWVGTYLRDGVTSFFADYVLSEYTTQNMAARLLAPDQSFTVSQNTTGIDGYICVHRGRRAPVGDAMTEIRTLYVQPRHHGKGIGLALLTHACEACRARGDHALWLTTNSLNTPAIRFYLANGFERVGQTMFTIDDQDYPNDVFVRKL